MSLGRLFVSVGANTQEFEQAMNNMQGRLQKTGQNISNTGKTMSKWVTGPIVAAGAGLYGLATKAGNYADSVLDASDATGLSTDAVQEWEHVAKQAGVSTDAMTGAAGRLNRQWSSIQDGSGSSAQAIDELNLSASELDDLDTDQRLDEITKALADVEDPAERARIGSDLFGRRWEEIAPIIGEGSEALDEMRDSYDGVLDEDQLKAADEFRQATETLRERFDDLVNTLGAELGPVLQDTIIPAIEDKLIPFAEDLAGRISDLVEWFTELDPSMQKIIFAGIGIIAAAGPILFIVGKMISLFSALIPIFTATGKAIMFMLSPIGLKILAIAAIVAAIVALWYYWDEIWDWVTDKLEAAAEWIGGIIDSIVEFFSELPGRIWEWLTDLWGRFTQWLEAIWNVGTKVISSLIDSVVGFYADLPGRVWKWLTDLWGRFTQWLEDIWDAGTEGISSLIDSVVGFFADLPGRIWEWLTDLWGRFTGWIGDMQNRAHEFGSDILETIVDFFASLPGRIWDWLTDTLGNLRDWGIDMVSSAGDAASDLVDTVIDWISDLPGEMLEAGRNIIDNLIGGIRDSISGIGDAMGDAASAVRDFLPFSPAKEGPLADEPDFGSYLGEGVDGADRELQHKIDGVMSNINLSAPGVGDVGGRSAGAVNINLENHFGEDVTPAKYKRKQKQMLRELATEWGTS